MNDYVLLTDSSADLTDALVKELGVEVLPLSFTMRNKTYRNWPDNREIDPKDFYRQLREGEMATTSAVNVSDFTETIEPHLKEGRDVLVVAFSSGLSATCHSAQIAAQELSEQYPERKVYVVDSLCASLGQGLLVWYAARMKNEAGASARCGTGWRRTNFTCATGLRWTTSTSSSGAAAFPPRPPYWAPCCPSSLSCMWTTRAT